MRCRAGKHICNKSLTEWGYVTNTAILASINQPTSQRKTHFLKKTFSLHTQYGHSSLQALETTSAPKFICTEMCSPHHSHCERCWSDWRSESLSRNYTGQFLVSQAYAHSIVLTLYLKTRKTHEELSATIKVVFIFITSRLPQSFPLYSYQHTIQPPDHMTY